MTKPKAKTKTAQKTSKVKPGVTGHPRTKTVVSVLVDESGSMMPLHNATMDGFNEYVKSLRASLQDNDVYFSAITFDSRGVRILQKGMPISEAILLSPANYNPLGGTPLIDAAVKTILATDEVIRAHDADQAVVMIQTDGEENSSREYRLDALKAMIEERQAKGWQFVFLGAGINAFTAGSQFGIVGAQTMSYGHNDHNTRMAFNAMAQSTSQYATGVADNVMFNAAATVAAGENAHVTRSRLADINNAKLMGRPRNLKDKVVTAEKN